MENKIFCIDFRKFISSVSLALDLAEACAFRDKTRKIDLEVSLPDFSAHYHNFASHSKKTALIAMFIGKKLGYEAERLDNLYISSFLHDIGAVSAFSICHTESRFIYEHSEFGSQIVKKLPVSDRIVNIIKYHHEQYNGSGPNKLAGSDIPEEAAVIHIADMFELMYNDSIPNLLQREKITGWFKEKQGKMFDPYITEALLDAARSERFWLDIENINSDPDVLERIHPIIYAPVSMEKLNDISEVFAAIIDKKSSFTQQHSLGLSQHAAKLSKAYGFDKEKKLMMKIAASLHDLGKLSVPNSILDKPGKLTEDEFAVIKSHTYYTKLILDKIDGMELISNWAANHHETLKGTGYPENLSSDNLNLESRIIAVCDIYQALTEDRPYRTGMSKENAFSIIDNLVEKGDLDTKVVEALKDIV